MGLLLEDRMDERFRLDMGKTGGDERVLVTFTISRGDLSGNKYDKVIYVCTNREGVDDMKGRFGIVMGMPLEVEGMVIEEVNGPKEIFPTVFHPT